MRYEFIHAVPDFNNFVTQVKTIVYCPKDKIEDISIDQEIITLMYFLEFNKLSSKTKVTFNFHFTIHKFKIFRISP